jgi:hypothetical protein
LGHETVAPLHGLPGNYTDAPTLARAPKARRADHLKVAVAGIVTSADKSGHSARPMARRKEAIVDRKADETGC